jgi:nitrogen regulatory protein PII
MANKKLHLITVVVQQKVGPQVLDVALKAGASGATYFYAQGKGVRESLGAAGEDIEIGKRVVFIVTETSKTDAVLRAVVEAAKLHELGQGFAWVQEVVRTVGFTAPARS